MNAKALEKQRQRRIAKQALAAKLASKTDNEIAADIRQASDGFLASQEWSELRKKAFARYGAICARCGFEQRPGFPINFDHIKPRKFFPELALDIENLQPLCGKCNKQKGNKHCTDYRKH